MFSLSERLQVEISILLDPRDLQGEETSSLGHNPRVCSGRKPDPSWFCDEVWSEVVRSENKEMIHNNVQTYRKIIFKV